MKTDPEAGLHPAAGYDHFNFQRPARREGSLLAPFASITWNQVQRVSGAPAPVSQPSSGHPAQRPRARRMPGPVGSPDGPTLGA
jgi:hypothetical protein